MLAVRQFACDDVPVSDGGGTSKPLGACPPAVYSPALACRRPGTGAGGTLLSADCGLAIRGVSVGPSSTSRSPTLCQDVCRSESTNRRYVAFAPLVASKSP